MLPPKEKICRHYHKPCRDMVASEACDLWMNIRGAHPQTGLDMDQWGCVDKHMPLLVMSLGKLMLQAGAETEALRKMLEKARSARADANQEMKTITHEAAE